MVLVSVTWFSARAKLARAARLGGCPVKPALSAAAVRAVRPRPSVRTSVRTYVRLSPLCIYLEAVEDAGGHNERSSEAIVFSSSYLSLPSFFHF